MRELSMSPNQNFDNLFKKVKTVTKNAADTTGRQVKKVKLQTNIMTLNNEKNRHFTTIGTRAFVLFSEANFIDGKILLDRIRDEIEQIGRIDGRIREIESEIADLSANTQHVDVEDVTDEPTKE
jgi:hypothetical protein